MISPVRPDWDAPPDGDFARYVERLGATAPAAARPSHTTAVGAAEPTRLQDAPLRGESASPPTVQAHIPLTWLQWPGSLGAGFVAHGSCYWWR